MSELMPEETIVEILKRLPPETLVKCTSVCKQWRSLIKSLDFISIHLSYFHSHSLPPLFLLRRYTKPPKPQRPPRTQRPLEQRFSIRFDSNASSTTPTLPIYKALPCPFPPLSRHFFRVVGSLNGLVCLSSDASSTSLPTVSTSLRSALSCSLSVSGSIPSPPTIKLFVLFTFSRGPGTTYSLLLSKFFSSRVPLETD